MQRYLFEYKTFVSFILTSILTNLSAYTALAVRRSPYREGIVNTAAPGATPRFRSGVRRNRYK